MKKRSVAALMMAVVIVGMTRLARKSTKFSGLMEILQMSLMQLVG